MVFIFSLQNDSFGSESISYEQQWSSFCTVDSNNWSCTENEIESDGQFHFPTGIATDNLGNVYVADSWDDQIQKFTSDGEFITDIESIQLEDGRNIFEEIFDIDISNDRILVTDSRTDSIQILSILDND